MIAAGPAAKRPPHMVLADGGRRVRRFIFLLELMMDCLAG